MNNGVKWAVVIVLFLIIVAGAAAYALMSSSQTSQSPLFSGGPAPTNFAECAKMYPVTQSYPATCTTNLGVTFTQDIGNAPAMQNSIVVDSPKPGDTISSPLTITGKAVGSWYLEGEFPIEIKDSSGAVVGQGESQPLSAWTTTDFVNFNATITFTKPSFGSSGTVALMDGNTSSGQELDIPVTFQ